MQDMRIIETVAANVRQARKAAGLSQEELALEAEVDRTYVSQVERGKRNITIVVLARLARAMGTSAAALVNDLGRRIETEKHRATHSGIINAIGHYWAFPCMAALYVRWWSDDWLSLTSLI
jgi:transcriptional regulator with XRE-family HTH domain